MNHSTTEWLNNEAFCPDGRLWPLWKYGVEVVIAIVIVIGNIVVLLAILRNWKSLTRQQNLYRYVLSLVAADLLNGIILLLHALFWIILLSSTKVFHFHDENTQEVLRNLIIGALHGLTFASLASAALLNVVLRVTSTRALAQAAAIKPNSEFCYSGISWVRCPRTANTVIGLVWLITLTFLIIPMVRHCHMNESSCLNRTLQQPANGDNGSGIERSDASDCSILNSPVKRSYLITLNIFIACTWGLMIICNFSTTCIKTEVKKVTSTRFQSDGNGLKLQHSFGITRDTSSFFALIITLSLTISTIPNVVFTFITEAGSPINRLYFAKTATDNLVFVHLSAYFASAINPIIYTAMLSRLRSDVFLLLHFPRTISRGRYVMKTESAKVATRNSFV